jgi:HNH endonuclease
MSLVQTHRHPIVDSVLRFLACCDRCRNPVSFDFGPCSRCGQEQIDKSGRLNVFVPDRVLRTFHGNLHDWLADRWEPMPEHVFVHENAQKIQLFCTVARCSQCDEPKISSDTLRCGGCGHSALFREHGKIFRGILNGRLPVGFRMLVQSCYLNECRAPALRNRQRTAVRRVSQAERTLYELQGGQCYYCIRPLGGLRIPGGWVCDHLEPKCKGGTEAVENLALTCWSCNEQKGGRNENAYWVQLFAHFGGNEVSRRRTAMAHVRTWRAQRAGRKPLQEHARTLKETEWMHRIAHRARAYLRKRVPFNR